jgi:hypothetical protein
MKIPMKFSHAFLVHSFAALTCVGCLSESATTEDQSDLGSLPPLPKAGLECTYKTAWIFAANAEFAHEESVPFFERSTVRVRPLSNTQVEETFTLASETKVTLKSPVAGGYGWYHLSLPQTWSSGRGLNQLKLGNLRGNPHEWGLVLAPFHASPASASPTIYNVEYRCAEVAP